MNFVYLMDNIKPLNMDIVREHVEHLRQLDEAGKLLLCGPFTDCGGGMVVLECGDPEEAKAIAQSDPFIREGYKTYELRTIRIANKDNHYGLL